MDLTNVPTATLVELADPASAINTIGAVRSKPLQLALANVSGVLYVSKQHLGSWLPNGMVAGGATLPTVVVGAPVAPPVGEVLTASVHTAGTFTGAVAGNYTATQSGTTGVGTGATFTVTMDSTSVTAVVSIDTVGEGYVVGDRITLNAPSGSQTSAALIRVDSATV
tara:strand:+ start:150 stop:650 length:501 start_codon:yes stop_codon:yes gene_type:complete